MEEPKIRIIRRKKDERSQKMKTMNIPVGVSDFAEIREIFDYDSAGSEADCAYPLWYAL